MCCLRSGKGFSRCRLTSWPMPTQDIAFVSLLGRVGKPAGTACLLHHYRHHLLYFATVRWLTRPWYPLWSMLVVRIPWQLPLPSRQTDSKIWYPEPVWLVPQAGPPTEKYDWVQEALLSAILDSPEHTSMVDAVLQMVVTSFTRPNASPASHDPHPYSETKSPYQVPICQPS